MSTFEVLTLLIGSGLGLGILKVMFVTGKIVKTIETINSDIKSIKEDIKNIDTRLNEIDGRLSRLEGAFFERGQWESRSYKMAKNETTQHNYNKKN